MNPCPWTRHRQKVHQARRVLCWMPTENLSRIQITRAITSSKRFRQPWKKKLCNQTENLTDGERMEHGIVDAFTKSGGTNKRASFSSPSVGSTPITLMNLKRAWAPWLLPSSEGIRRIYRVSQDGVIITNLGPPNLVGEFLDMKTCSWFQAAWEHYIVYFQSSKRIYKRQAGNLFPYYEHLYILELRSQTESTP